MKRIIGMTAFLLVLALAASGCSALPFVGNGSYELRAEFDRTFNLFTGSPVRVLGVGVGKITELEISADKRAVTAVMTINEDVQVPEGARAVIVPEALLGERYIQLTPAYTDGPAMEPGTVIPLDRTQVPFEFDEVLEGLNDFVGALDEEAVGRFFANLADVLDGQGETLGQTIEDAHGAIQALQQSDEEIVSLANRLADLNETLATRDEAIGEIIEDWNTVTGSLAGDRQQIDAALAGLVRMTRQVGDLLQTHRTNLEEDIATLTRVGRTAQRNLDNVSMLTLGSAELFRHADRVINRDRNWLPLLDHKNPDALYGFIADDMAERLEGLCSRDEDIPQEVCDAIPFREVLGDVCIPDVIPCPEGESGVKTMAEALRDLAETSEEFRDGILNDDADTSEETSSSDDGGTSSSDINEAVRRIAEENGTLSDSTEVAP
ncbi:MAG: MlaD family protein [Nitriliruptorales bacterium]|nr:MlaD family protein [Nitriliruptorales bacterium]